MCRGSNSSRLLQFRTGVTNTKKESTGEAMYYKNTKRTAMGTEQPQWIKALASEPGNLNLVPETLHSRERKPNFYKVFSDLHKVYTYLHTHKYITVKL